MNNVENIDANSEESDEDFCPNKEDVSDDEVSYESSAGAEDSQDEDTKADENKEIKKKKLNQIVRKKKKTKKKIKESSHLLETEEEVLEKDSRRCTRQVNNCAANDKQIEKDELVSDEEDKTRTDALWADFLSNVKPVTGAIRSRIKNRIGEGNSASSTIFSKGSSTEKTDEKSSEVNSDENKALTKKITTEIIDFAGEEIRVGKIVSSDCIKEKTERKTKVGLLKVGSRSLQTGLKRPAGSVGGGGCGGLGSMLNQLEKKKKMSVLEKTQMDWKSFKQDEGIEEELLTHNKGKDGFLERQDFLQRTDIRQFEIEKSLRQSRRNN